MIPASHQDVLDAQALGQEAPFALYGVASGAQTAGTTQSGNLTVQMLSHGIGATIPSARVGLDSLMPPGVFGGGRDVRLAYVRSQGTRVNSYGIANFVKLGSIDFTATGQRFTHHASTGPYLKKQMGQNAPVAGPLLLDFQVAMSGFAAVISTFTFVDQDGNTVVNNLTWTAPAASVTLGSGLTLPLDAPASGARDLVSVNVSTAATTGVADVYLLEHLEFASQQSVPVEVQQDAVFGGFAPELMNPPVASSGTADVKLLPYGVGTGVTNTAIMLGTAVVGS